MNNTPLESEEQIALIEWLEIKRLKFTSVPNSTFTRSWKQKNKNTRMGLRAGLPDLVVIVPKHLLFIEMKRKKGSRISEEQKGWIAALNDINKHVVAKVCKGADEAINFIKIYI